MNARLDDVLARDQARQRGRALQALLMRPLLAAGDPAFAAVRQHAEVLRPWLARELGWPLQVDRECARLYKRPADLGDASRGLPEFNRRRYVLLCLGAAVLERADAQITLRTLGERLISAAADAELAALDFSFTLEKQHERRDLVHVCRWLLELGVLSRVAGDEEAFVQQTGDALYDVHRRLLSTLLAATRGPSTWPAEQAPRDLDARLASLTQELAPDGADGQLTRMRHRLARRLLDDPVVYFDELPEDERAYLANQRGPMAARLCETSGLVPEQRAEGLALVDPEGEMTDALLPAEGTEAHVTLLVTQELARRERTSPGSAVSVTELQAFIRACADEYGRYWRKAARSPGAERELCSQALDQLAALKLIRLEAGAASARPALLRYALGEPVLRQAALL